MSDRKQQRLRVLSRLREMKVEQARAEHVTAQEDLDAKRERADDTQRRIETLDAWLLDQLSRGTKIIPELMRQARMFRAVEKQALDSQRAEQEQSRRQTEAARDELREKFEELSVVERLAVRHQQSVSHENLRLGYVELDEAGAQRKNLEAKE
jgi:hypothetical protein